jgi:hypothetical protein
MIFLASLAAGAIMDSIVIVVTSGAIIDASARRAAMAFRCGHRHPARR